jgi:hypothetical protein
MKKIIVFIISCFILLSVNNNGYALQNTDFIKITRILVDTNLDSYFEESEIPTNNLKYLGKYSDAHKVQDLYFRNSIEEVYDFHPAPQKQYIIYLSGKAEITTSKGETKTFIAGDILSVEDNYGKGHKSSIIEEGKALIITQ